MRSYDVAVAALAIDAPAKWMDNLLSQHSIAGVQSARRGIARRISRPAILRIAVIRLLSSELGTSVAAAVSLAGTLLDSHASAVTMGRHFTLTLDRQALERSLDDRLRDVLETAPVPRRGRPPRRQPAE